MKKPLIQFILSLVLLAIPLASLTMPLVALAENGEETPKGFVLDSSLKPEYATNIEVEGTGNRASLANAVLQMMAGGLIYLAGPIAVLMLAFGGLRYITSRGDQTQMEEAKKTITWAIAGLIVIILSWAIITNIMWISLHGGTIGTDKEADYTKLPATEQTTPAAAGETAPATETPPGGEPTPE